MQWVNDERDLSMVRFLFVSCVLVGGAALYLYLPGRFHWWLGLGYLALNLGVFIGPFTLLLHNVSHRPFFKRERWWMGRLIPWLWGPLFGQTPESYFVHHIGMHHTEGNMEADASSTLAYQRDSALDFLRYTGRFMAIGWVDLSRYFRLRGKRGLLRRFWVGEAVWAAVVAALLVVNWRASVVVLIIPFFTIRFLMMAGNWAQHAFIDAADPGNPFKNSITCINSTYNRRCFNDGYHIGHHVKMNRHWTEMPEDFARNVDAYVRERAIVFRGLDFFGVWVCLMLKRYDWLAHRYVDLSGEGPTSQDVIALLKMRTQRIALAA
jgi:fatty acid desaturase